MKIKLIIIIAIFVYAAAMVGSYFWVDNYINKKVNRLKYENRENIINVFLKYDKKWGRRIYGVFFSPQSKVEYEKVPVPQKPILKPSETIAFQDGNIVTIPGDSISEYDKQNYDKSLEHWKDYYHNISKMYIMKKKNWQLSLIYFKGYNADGYEAMGLPCIDVYGIYPYAVGYFRQEYSSYYSYEPKIEDALENAYDFWTSSDKSWYVTDYNFAKNNYDNAISELSDCNNEYFWLTEDFEEDIQNSQFSLNDDRYLYNDKRLPFDNLVGRENCYMYNGYYKVYDAKVWQCRYSVKKQHWAINSDKKSLRIKWAVWLTIILLAIIIPLIVMEKKKQKLQSETLYDKLKRLCNPSNFMKNYDKEKVDAANEIYQRLLQTRPDDKEVLNEIQAEAVEKLKITLIDQSLLDELKKKVNPQNFMKNYDAEKVSLANDLYARLSKDNLTYNEFIEIQELSKQL
ncbi:MAG: hypothetical protein II937_11310 [Bacteroidales bacterium]|nr:hypothetical protein [Bacteroidales bacterium]